MQMVLNNTLFFKMAEGERREREDIGKILVSALERISTLREMSLSSENTPNEPSNSQGPQKPSFLRREGAEVS